MLSSEVLQAKILRFVFLAVLFIGISVFTPATGSCEGGGEPPWQAPGGESTLVVESTSTYVKVIAVDESGNPLVDALGELLYYLIVL